MHNPSGATALQHFVARLGHLYPLYSGCATIASHPVFRSMIGDTQRLVWAQTASGIIKVTLTDYVGKALFFFGDLDPKITWVVKRLVQPGQTVADVGANVGVVTLLLSKCVGPQGKVLAFEPNPYLANFLRETLRENTIVNTELYELGLGATLSEMELSVPHDNMGRGSLLGKFANDDQLYKVKINTLDQICSYKIDFIKIDVEGFELQVFEGGKTTFNQSRPIVVLEENRPRSHASLPGSLSFLLERGYRLIGIPKSLFRLKLYLISESHFDGNLSHDFIAIPEEKFNTYAPRLNLSRSDPSY